ncbi:MAG: uroporphyrinogen-III C-methyltransferase [Pseudonocardiales bacterium]|nr:uroporphyrinogen-III C-methyltransferase [Pseudonocardiales bacterium]
MTVHVVGAGPGDPQLITRRGAALLARARHVVYDRPSMAGILALAPTATRHCVGKQGATPAPPQHEINALLVELGRTGECVVRLKAGDPFVVSRGSEEALALARAGVGVEIVPGVSAALAAPAAAGIPVMVRQLSRTLTVIAGSDDVEEVDWDALARLGGTVVLLTGRAVLHRVLAALRAAGMPPGTPVAAISAASRPQHRTVRGTLADPPPARLPAPLTIVIGDVAALDVTAGEVSCAHP